MLSDTPGEAAPFLAPLVLPDAEAGAAVSLASPSTQSGPPPAGPPPLLEGATSAPLPEGEALMPFTDHLAELRSRLAKSLAAVGLGAALILYFHEPMVAFLRHPLVAAGLQTKLITTAPTEYFVAVMKIALIGGLGLTLPFVLYQILAFLHPGLTPQERRWVLPLSLGGSVSFIIGMAFGFYVMLPAGLSFLIGFSGGQVETMLAIGRYVGFAGMVVLSCGLSFELPLIMLAAAAAGLVTSHVLAPRRREAAIASLAIAAVISPSIDVVTQLMMGGALYLLFELGLLLQRAIGR